MFLNKNNESRPCLLVFAGPNGSGKSTITRNIPLCGLYVNADEIKRISGCTDLEAAQEAEQLREALLASGKDFTFQGTMGRFSCLRVSETGEPSETTEKGGV